MMNDKADEIIEELFDSLKNRYENNLESVKGSRFVVKGFCIPSYCGPYFPAF